MYFEDARKKYINLSVVPESCRIYILYRQKVYSRYILNIKVSAHETTEKILYGR